MFRERKNAFSRTVSFLLGFVFFTALPFSHLWRGCTAFRKQKRNCISTIKRAINVLEEPRDDLDRSSTRKICQTNFTTETSKHRTFSRDRKRTETNATDRCSSRWQEARGNKRKRFEAKTSNGAMYDDRRRSTRILHPIPIVGPADLSRSSLDVNLSARPFAFRSLFLSHEPLIHVIHSKIDSSQRRTQARNTIAKIALCPTPREQQKRVGSGAR